MVVVNDYDIQEVTETVSAFFGPLTEEQRRYVMDNFEMRIYEKGEALYEENDYPRYMMCLLHGKVMISKQGNGGRPQIIRMIKEEAFFGYRPAITGEDHHTSAYACEESTIGVIPIEVVKEMVRNNNSLAVYFLKQLASLLGDADMLTVSLTQKHTRGRLAQSLLALKEKYGVEEDGCTLNIRLSREELANMSNMITNNAIRTLSAFASEGLVDVSGKEIRIIDERRLLKVSQTG